MKNHFSMKLGLGAVSCAGAVLCAAEIQKPNVIVIYADDLGIGDISTYFRDGKIPTPNIDRLAADGIRFSKAGAARRCGGV